MSDLITPQSEEDITPSSKQLSDEALIKAMSQAPQTSPEISSNLLVAYLLGIKSIRPRNYEFGECIDPIHLLNFPKEDEWLKNNMFLYSPNILGIVKQRLEEGIKHNKILTCGNTVIDEYVKDFIDNYKESGLSNKWKYLPNLELTAFNIHAMLLVPPTTVQVALNAMKKSTRCL